MFRGPNFKGDFIQVDRLADGVITFLDVDNAERFKSLLEAEQTHAPVTDLLHKISRTHEMLVSIQIEICEMTSDTLFRGCLDAKAVVVWMKLHDYCPTVSEITTSLKAQLSLEGGDV